jgi:hypothetical protein
MNEKSCNIKFVDGWIKHHTNIKFVNGWMKNHETLGLSMDE